MKLFSAILDDVEMEQLETLSEKEGCIEEKALWWKTVVQAHFSRDKFDLWKEVFYTLYKKNKAGIAWLPSPEDIENSNLAWLIEESGSKDYKELFSWAASFRGLYWEKAVKRIGIACKEPYLSILDTSHGVEEAIWMEGALINIADSCFLADKEKIAIVEGCEDHSHIKKVTYEQLDLYSNRIANGLVEKGYKRGDRFVLYLPFSIDAVATYLGLVKAGMISVSVADSFSPTELAKRVEMTGTKAIITVNRYTYGGKTLHIYDKVKEANCAPAILINADREDELRAGDLQLEHLLSANVTCSEKCDPYDITNILFSSGTTKEPKSIPWTHTTPVKCAADGHFHLNIKETDVVTWTTGMGWMMAPWLIYAGLINKATIALFTGSAVTDQFGKFAEQAGITIMGTIPSVVRGWIKNDFITRFNWKVRLYASTGEPSNTDDYLYLMGMSDFKAPIIEYCGGTEIGGSYITGTVCEPVSPSTFTTPALGLNFYLLNEHKQPAKAHETGEVFLVPPSIGLSQTLLNKNHHEEYFKGMPAGPGGEVLRKHGDAFEVIQEGPYTFYKSVGRTDDAMNLGGIKISAVEIEETLNKHPQVLETAAVSVAPATGGPERLVIFYTERNQTLDETQLKKNLQDLLTSQLNPLFRISQIIKVQTIPRTASNKIMRRELRKVLEEV
jgi:acetyl-CoA synthetase